MAEQDRTAKALRTTLDTLSQSKKFMNKNCPYYQQIKTCNQANEKGRR